MSRFAYVTDRVATTVGAAVFSITVNGVRVGVTYPGSDTTSTDIYLVELTGAATGEMITSPTVTPGGSITVAFTAKVGTPVINAIELVSTNGIVPAAGTADDA